MGNNPIIVFEHSTLHLNEQGFNPEHFKALVKFNDQHGGKYFIPGLNKLRFKSYVGVIQVGNRSIEILPKADNSSLTVSALETKWQKALLYMLKQAGYIKVNETEEASQKLIRNNLLEIYLYTFLKEVEKLVHAGLVKKYRRERENKTALRGKLLIEKQIQFNSVHKECFFTEHTVYNTDNKFNAILKAALDIIQSTSTNYTIKQESAKQLLYFENIECWKGQSGEFDRLVYDRKTKQYEYAIRIARMIILNYSPDLTSGGKPIIAILFNMNRLFEKFIFRMLQREELNFTKHKLHISSQNSLPFWNSKTIRPDILISYEKEIEGKVVPQKVVIDTKWKIIDAGNPSDDDLKQMYAYNFQFGSNRSVLFYPSVGQKNSGAVNYDQSQVFPEHQHCCELYFAELFENGEMRDSGFAGRFLEYLIRG